MNNHIKNIVCKFLNLKNMKNTMSSMKQVAFTIGAAINAIHKLLDFLFI